MIVNAIVTLDERSTLAGVTGQVQQLERAGVTAITLEGLSEGLMGASSPGEVPAPSRFESTTLCGYLARKTTTIGIVPANSALYGFPYHLARRLATLDHLTEGRAGWAIRTSTPDRDRASFDWRSSGVADERQRAAEYIQVALALWDSWEPGAAAPNKVTGDFKDDSRIHPIDYHTEAFLVKGPLDVPRSPQGRPMVFADLADADDAQLVARFADVVSLAAQTFDQASALSSILTAEANALGRAAAIRILPIVSAGPLAGSFALGWDTAEAIAQVKELVASTSAAGITVRYDGTEEGMRWLTEELVPGLGLDDTSLSGPLLSDRLGFSHTIEHGRRAA